MPIATTRSFGTGVLSTINPEKVGAQATDRFATAYRPLQWMHNPTEQNLTQPENDAALYTLLTMLAPYGASWTNPTLWWRVDNKLNMVTTLAAAVSAADTKISVVQPRLLKAGYTLYLPETNQNVLVLAVDEDLSEGWTNDGAVACNVSIDRTILPGPALAATVGQEVRAGAPLMGEFGEPKEGIITVPGDPMFNFIQLFGLYIKMSRMQYNSLMAGDVGTHEALVRDNESFLSQQLQTTLLFGRRGTYAHPDEGMVYLTNGLVPQLQDNVLSVKGVGNALTFRNMSDFCDGTCESANSSASKVIVTGERLFMHLLDTAVQENRIVANPAYNPQIGVQEFQFNTRGGKSMKVMKMRFAFQGRLADWGLVLDLPNISTAEYNGFGWRWLSDLEAPMQGITTLTDALIGSIAVTVRDPSTCGVIRGGVSPVLSDRNGLGIVTNY